VSRAIPILFVVLWSTGFIGAKAVVPYVEPATFLALRFGIVAVIVLVIALATRSTWPRGRRIVHVAVVGVFLHAVYLGGVFASVHQGLPTGVSALIVGLQPILAATVAGPLLGERVTRLQWSGLLLGLVGVAMVLGTRLQFAGATAWPTVLSLVALVGITVGTLYQKRFCTGVDVWPGAVIQYTTATVAMLACSAAFETGTIAWSWTLVASLAWLVVVLSIGAVSLLMLLIRRGSAAGVSALLYLTPPLAAVEAWLWFDETLGALAIAGIAVTAAGVALVQRGARA
jgi:drug/metabolite transporter (DMT)-like permease